MATLVDESSRSMEEMLSEVSIAETEGSAATVETDGRPFEAEQDVGNIEYKRCLLSTDYERIDRLTTQLSYRLSEGGGLAQYRLGIEDDGNYSRLDLESIEKSILQLELMAESISARLTGVERISYTLEDTAEDEKGESKQAKETYYHALVKVESTYDDDTSKTDVRVAVCGNVDAGKSTCIGVLKTGMLDDGRGKARISTMVHQHEINTGRTSTVSSHIIGFKCDGGVTNYDARQSLDAVVKNSARLLSLVDLAGHEKYLRSMIYGVSSSLLDYALVLINARSGVTHMTHHHVTICACNRIPMLILLSKVDGCPEHRYRQTIEETKEMMKSADIRKRMTVISPREDDMGAALNTVLSFMNTDRQTTIPAIPVSFVEGTNLDFVKMTLRFIPKRRRHADKKDKSLEFIVDRLYNVPGVGPVILGFVNQGTVTANSVVFVGPVSESGEFVKSNIKTIHYNTLPVKQVPSGNFACLAVKLDKNTVRLIRRGLVLMEEPPEAVRRFRARVNIIHNQHTTIKEGYMPYLHILMVRQSAIVEHIQCSEDASSQTSTATTSNLEEKTSTPTVLRPGAASIIITFRFAYRCEYVRKGMRVMFRDGKVNGYGQIIETLTG
jgi:elongation factor 1-alpha